MPNTFAQSTCRLALSTTKLRDCFVDTPQPLTMFDSSLRMRLPSAISSPPLRCSVNNALARFHCRYSIGGIVRSHAITASISPFDQFL